MQKEQENKGVVAKPKNLAPHVINKQWTDAQITQLMELVEKLNHNWKQIAQELNKKELQCKLQYALKIDTEWTQQEEDNLRTWWEFHDKDKKLDFTQICEQLNNHKKLCIQRKLQMMTSQGIYKVPFDLNQID
ncbi:Myb-like_DNA-binding domain-containing protein [Hexamita inflata]|uniref:Myb-like DNA-binding domain-containing protein n=1 Tax=Hexamita inflata TaxID=28002 RepID=A0AA86NVX3_9EUKA|nr:Myb-like DNA-binding domain-containing protein [Hexamita inflata]CAI9960062.1 Myb-like DNA-binding domain-containing protein [Hexamita inflata]